MPSRAELNLRAYAVGFDAATIPNDSKLEQKVLFLEKNSYTVTGTKPTTTLTSSNVASDGETVTIGPVTYTFKTALSATPTANEVLIGAAATNSLDNIKSAINGTGTPGTDYSQPTKRHPLVTAGAKNSTTLVIAATDTNTVGALATTETCANWAFTGATLASGVLGGLVAATGTTTGVVNSVGAVSGDANVSL